MQADIPTFSVWMIPEEPALTELSNRIRRFAQTHSTPFFVPHVTLVGDIAGDETELADFLGRVSSGFSRHTLTVAGIEAEELFFKSLYLDLTPQPGLIRAQTALAQRLPISQHPRQFQPHISMAYGSIPPKVKAMEAKALEPLIGTRLSFRHLHLVKSSQNVPIKDWQTLQSFALESL